MKRYSIAACVAALLAVGFLGAVASADKATAAKTITGKSGCATCDGVTTEGHSILLTDKDGTRWVLLGSGANYEAVHSIRSDGKKIVAVLAGDPMVKKDPEGREYKEVKISDVKLAS